MELSALTAVSPVDEPITEARQLRYAKFSVNTVY